MNFAGVQKLTLLDYPGKLACTLFTKSCNFRCPWCHNYDIAILDVDDQRDSFNDEQILDFLKTRQDYLEGVVISGGEPCLQYGLPEFLEKIRALGYLIKLDTNGSVPMVLKYLIDNRLVDYVAMDIKNCPEKYSKTIGTNKFSFEQVRASIDILLGSDSIDYEFRTTVVDELHEPEDFKKIGEIVNGAKRYMLTPFIYNIGVPDAIAFHTPNAMKMTRCLNTIHEYVLSSNIR